ncbi:alpha/beta hydrolase [Patescibacteria group bacterium]|nr:alpha/beta hydrolase [Patescibacteria group bacterium]
MNVFIFHGTMGSPEGNWFPWLERELKKLGIEVFVPRFPTPKGQTLDNWLKTFEPYQKLVNDQTVFVGHSMGSVLALRILEKRTTPILGSILVAPFYQELHLGEEFDKLLRSFINHPFNWEKIKGSCHQFVIFDGDDDPYIPISQPQYIAEKLGAKLIIIPGGKHLNGEQGFFEFPQALEAIKKLKIT